MSQLTHPRQGSGDDHQGDVELQPDLEHQGNVEFQSDHIHQGDAATPGGEDC